MVNRWFDNRIILIGDAAHVFPPFGAQGIANGIRDALSLSWRLSLMLNFDSYNPDLLNQWSRERRYGVDESSRITMVNGDLLRNKSFARVQMINMVSGFLEHVPSVRNYLLRSIFADNGGFKPVKDGFFLPRSSGGGKSGSKGPTALQSSPISYSGNLMQY